MLLIASGSGESTLPIAIARLGKEFGAKLALITSAHMSTLKSMSDIVVHLRGVVEAAIVPPVGRRKKKQLGDHLLS